VTIVAETDLTDITGVRLEVLTDSRLPSKGPGRAPDGNFVLTELELTAAPKADPKKTVPVKLQTPLADFSQANFEVAKAIDGNHDDNGGGWAVSPSTGIVHWASFETKDPLGKPGGTILTVQLHHKFVGNVYALGRFRLSVTRVPRPIGLGVPEEFRTYLATVPELRTQAQRDNLLAYFQSIDNDWRAKVDAVNASRAPLPVDPKLNELRNLLEAAKRPVPVDKQLAQLRHDVEMSIRQEASRRLTAAQDIAWALINSPSFLFNH
jgi:hypothetical protein